ncbi:MAG: hypothetical protein U0610_17740 [bacterium]
MQLETVLLDPDDAPAHQRLAAKAAHLRGLGMTLTDIGRALGVSRFVVRKARRWVEDIRKHHAPNFGASLPEPRPDDGVTQARDSG